MEISALVPIQRTVTGHNNPSSNKHMHSSCLQTGIHSWNFPCIHKNKKGPPQFKISFSAPVKFAALITSSSLNFKKKKSVTVACDETMAYEETSCTQKKLQKRTQNLLGGRTVAQGYLLELQLA